MGRYIYTKFLQINDKTGSVCIIHDEYFIFRINNLDFPNKGLIFIDLSENFLRFILNGINVSR